MAARPDRGRDDRVCVAQIGAAHGLKGDVRLFSFTQDPNAVTAYGALEVEDGSRNVEIATLRAAKDHFVAKLRGVDDRDAADALRNIKLYISRDRLPPPEDGAFYHADLIGLRAVSASGDDIGEVVSVQNYGAGDIIELRPAAGGDHLLLPFTENVVPQIDLAGRKIVVVPPDEVVADEKLADD